MKKCILLTFFMISMPAIASNNTVHESEVVAAYQERCAKEHDPVKRQNYCYMIENHSRSHTRSNVFRLDTAVV